MTNLATIRAKLAAAESKNNHTNTSYATTELYPHWNIAEGETAIIRLLPDNDDDNAFFWREATFFRIPFDGVKGNPTAKPFQLKLPCMDMYDEKCGALDIARQFYKDGNDDMGRTYWKKRSYMYQGLVKTDPLNQDPIENPIRQFQLSPTIHKIIESSLMDPELEETPVDYVKGLDFRINKTSKGGHADYTTSNFARKETAIDTSIFDGYELKDLMTYLPEKPDAELQQVVIDIINDSIAGELYDEDKYGMHFKAPNRSK